MGDFKLNHRYSEEKVLKTLGGTRIKHRDKFDVKALYSLLHEWLIERNYGPKSDKKWPETYYLHRFYQKNGEEINIWWRFRKEINKMIRYDLDVDWEVIGMKPAELVKNGKKYKTNTAEVEVKVTGRIVLLQNKEWNNSPILRKIKDVFLKRIYYPDIARHRSTLLQDIDDLKHTVKTYLQMQLQSSEVQGNNFFNDKSMGTPFLETREDMQG